jgi:tetratricopeptide (TPR) repeat protein
LAEEIINALTRLPGLRVTARTSSFLFRGKEADVREIGARLNVENILEGSVRKAGNRIRVTTQLVSAADGYHLWSEVYDREMTDVFAIQDEICRAIVDKLRVELAIDRPIVRRTAGNVEAYNLRLKGRHSLPEVTPESLGKSRDFYQQAIAADPGYAQAWCDLAQCYLLMGFFGFMPPKEANIQCGQAAQKALDLDELQPHAHAMLGVLRAVDYDWQGAEREFRRALELDPKSEDIFVWTNYDFYYLAPMKRLDEAIAAMQRAVELDPLSPFLHFRLSMWYGYKHQWNRAIEHARNAAELNPRYYLANLALAFVYTQTGRHDEAIRAAKEMIQILGRTPYSLGFLASTYAKAGKTAEARKLLAELQSLAQKSYVPPLSLANIYFGLGEIEKGFDWLEKAVDQHETDVIHLGIDPAAEALRSHSRYKTLMQKMNLEP